MLKMTGVQLQLLKDIEHHLFVESGRRGGVEMVPNRHAVTNNPRIPDRIWLTTLSMVTLAGEHEETS